MSWIFRPELSKWVQVSITSWTLTAFLHIESCAGLKASQTDLIQEYNGWWFLFLGSSQSPPDWQWLEMLFGPCQTCAEGRTHHLNLTRWGINPFLLMGTELILEREPHQDPEVCYLERWSDKFKLNVCWSLLISNKVDGDGSISMKFCWDQGCQAASEICLVPASFPLPSSLLVPKV